MLQWKLILAFVFSQKENNRNCTITFLLANLFPQGKKWVDFTIHSPSFIMSKLLLVIWALKILQFEYYGRVCRFSLDLHSNFTENNEKTILLQKKKYNNKTSFYVLLNSTELLKHKYRRWNRRIKTRKEEDK